MEWTNIVKILSMRDECSPHQTHRLYDGTIEKKNKTFDFYPLEYLKSIFRDEQDQLLFGTVFRQRLFRILSHRPTRVFWIICVVKFRQVPNKKWKCGQTIKLALIRIRFNNIKLIVVVIMRYNDILKCKIMFEKKNNQEGQLSDPDNH